MDVENPTPFPTKVLRETLDDTFGILITATKVTYAANGEGGALVLAKAQTPLYLEPCDEAPMGEINPMREPGVADITVLGDIVAPGEDPAPSVDVELAWGDEKRTLRAFGPRSWLREGEAGFRPSDPEPFVRLPMAWRLAFGGKHIIPAGFAPHSDLPMPAGELSYSANPEGTGFCFEPEQVEGMPLPSLEDPAALIKDWRDQPRPACFAPMPFVSSLRGEHIAIDHDTGDLRSTHGEQEMTFARVRQNAPPWLQVRGLAPGTRFRLAGMTPDKPLEFALPPPPVRWLVATGKRSREQDIDILAVQIRPNERLVTVLFGGKVFYPLIKGQARRASLIPTPEAAAQLGPA